MKIQKKYHFYAAHRNKSAGEKCGRIHGHTYNVVCDFKFNEIKDGITMLFSDIDAKVEPIIKSHDHYLLLHDQDPLCIVLDTMNEPFIKLPFETSAENMAIWLYNRIRHEGEMPIVKIQIGETKTSTVIYEP